MRPTARTERGLILLMMVAGACFAEYRIPTTPRKHESGRIAAVASPAGLAISTSGGKSASQPSAGDISRPKREKHGGLSTQACAFFIFKLVVGSSVFCLPGAASGTGLATAVAMAGIFAMLSGYCFFLVGRSCDDCGAVSFQQLWERSGPPLRLPRQSLSWVVLAMAFGTCLQFSISLGASLESIVKHQLLERGLGFADILPGDARRLATLLVTVVGILPLVSLPTLESLKFTTMLGSYSFLFAASSVVLRALDGTYEKGGKYFDVLASAPSGGVSRSSPWRASWATVTLLASLTTAFEGHCDPPRYLLGLKPGERPGQRLARFKQATFGAFAAAGLMYALVIAAGRKTFGERGAGDFLLAAYAPGDGLMRAAQLLTALNMLCGYPLYFDALRKAVLNLAPRQKAASGRDATDLLPFPWQMALLAAITFLATYDGIDLLFVMSVRGALLGSFILYILPPALSLAVNKLQFRQPPLAKPEMVWLRSLLGYGVGALVLATAVTTGLTGA